MFATLGGKMDVMPAGWPAARSALEISTAMMPWVLAAFGERAGGGVWLKSVPAVALACLNFALNVRVKRRREGRPLDSTTR